jgi:short-subunit dehydrogenase
MTTALVTGASGGIGEDIARLLVDGGCNVVLLARSATKLEALAAELSRSGRASASVLTADLSDPAAVDRIVRTLEEQRLSIDILVNNAGFGLVGEFARDDPQEQLRMIQVNVVALTNLTRRLLPGMIERRHGRVLNVASTAAFQPGPLMAVYYATKAYVLSLSDALSEETSGTGVTVTCLCPGPTQTGFQDRAQMQNTRLVNVTKLMTSAEVARAGYDGMMAGRRLVIPGLLNKIAAQSVRLMPRRLVARVVRSLNAER